MDKIWRKNGLDLKMVTFACVPTGPRRGFVELVTGAETLRRIQVEHGLTGSFKDRPIADWLAKHNPSPLEYERAVHNFTASCAGYSVATYVFGVCDRHNDNIMVYFIFSIIFLLTLIIFLFLRSNLPVICFISTLENSSVTLKCLVTSNATEHRSFSPRTWLMSSMAAINRRINFSILSTSAAK